MQCNATYVAKPKIVTHIVTDIPNKTDVIINKFKNTFFHWIR